MTLVVHRNIPVTILIVFLAAWTGGCNNKVSALSTTSTVGTSSGTSSGGASKSLYQILDSQTPVQAWKTIFGDDGERGEYMDGYSQQAMIQRCQEDYKWGEEEDDDENLESYLLEERAKMMSHLYDNEQLWEHVCMVAFAEHYLSEHPFETFQRHKTKKETTIKRPIFTGVVLSDWQSYDDDEKGEIQDRLTGFKEKGIDYVRLECNFGLVEDIGGPEQLVNNPLFQPLVQCVKACQQQEMVPVVLMQVPWREPGESSIKYFDQAINTFAMEAKNAGVEPQKLLLETRPPVAVSANEERGLAGTKRISLGLQTGQRMFEAIHRSFTSIDDNGDENNNMIAGFCVAGGSTKGDNPTAMEDDTQNAVRQGMRQYAKEQLGHELCFWEMGAKLMLQPKVGRLWGTNSQAGRDAARELFCVNAKDLSDEIKTSIII